MIKKDHHGSNNLANGPFWSRALPLESETSAFVLVNALDLMVTYLLLWRGPEFLESNPLAAAILSRAGFRGLIAFKFAIVAMVCLIAQTIALKQILTARIVLLAGTIVVGLVVAYSVVLGFRHG